MTVFIAPPSSIVAAQVAGPVRMRAERLPRQCLRRYETARREALIYDVAARLWGRGLLWEEAREAAEAAFSDALT